MVKKVKSSFFQLVNMFSYLDSLRQKPDTIRKRYAFGISIVLFMLIAGGWGMATTYKTHEKEAPALAKNEPSPMGSLVGNISAGYKEVKESIAGSNPFMAEVNTADAATTTSQTSSVVIEPVFDQVIITDSPSE
jgi:hypothetical protein